MRIAFRNQSRRRTLTTSLAAAGTALGVFAAAFAFSAEPAFAAPGEIGSVTETTEAVEAVEAAQAKESAAPTVGRVIEALSVTPPGHVKPLRFSMLLSLDGYVGPRRANDNDAGFDLSDARLLVAGELEHGFGYLVQANLIQSRPVLDVILDWKSPPHGFRVGAGFFRTPFSGEIQVPAPRLDFIERSQIVRALAPVRQVGLQIDQEVLGDALVARAGAFNGNGFDSNDDERFLYILRFDGRIRSRDENSNESIFEYGVNGAYSEDDNVDLGFDLGDNFAGKRWLAGADVRWTTGPVFFSAEGLYGSLDPNGSSRRNVYGYQVSMGWDVHRLVQLLVRYDALYAASLREDRELAIASVVLNFTKIVSLQFEIRVPTRGEPATPGGAASFAFTF